MNDYVLTVNDDGDLAIRTVPGTEDSNVTDTTSVITRTDDGKLAVRVVGSGGGDSHNLGYFDTLQDLQTAYPTGEAGDWAIVAESDTVYIWDETQQAWVDTDRKGQVTSVNNQTGDVTLDINDVAPTQTGKSGYVLGTDGFVAGWVRPEIVQRSALPQASEEEVNKIYQYVGTTDANYTNGYFYKCVSDGQVPATYSWTAIEVQDGLPSQTGQSGKFLTTNGTDASWSDTPLVNKATGGNTLSTLVSSTVANSTIINSTYGNGAGCVAVGVGAGPTTNAANVTCVGYGAEAQYNSSYSVCIGVEARVYNKFGAIQLGKGTNNEASTFCVGLVDLNVQTHNYKLLDADGTIPEARLADTTSATAGQALVLDSNLNAVWTDVDSLPNQTGNAGKFLKTDGTNATWENITTSPATAPTLVAANWSSNTQTITVQGVTATNTIIVSPIPTDAEDYAAAGVLCVAQGSGTLTFSCTTTPVNDLQVNVVII